MPHADLPPLSLALIPLLGLAACAPPILTPSSFPARTPGAYVVPLGAPPASIVEPASTDDAGLVIEGRLGRVRSLGNDAWRYDGWKQIGMEIRDGLLVFDNTQILLLERSSGQPRRMKKLPSGSPSTITAIAATAAGDRLAARGYDGEIIYYPTPDAAPQIIPPPPLVAAAPRRQSWENAWIRDAARKRLAFSSDGRRLLTGTNVYDLEAKAYLFAFESGEEVIDMSLDEALVAVESTPPPSIGEGRHERTEARRLEQISVRRRSGEPRRYLPTLNGLFPRAASLTERWMLVPTSARDNTVALVDLDTGALRASNKPGLFNINALFTPHSAGLWRSAGEGVTLLDATGAERFTWRDPNPQHFSDRNTHLRASPDGHRIALLTFDRYMRRDSPPTFVVSDDGTAYEAGRAHALLWLDARRLVLSSTEGSARILDVQAHEVAAPLPRRGVTAIDIASDGTIALIDDNRARLVTGDRATPLTPPEGWSDEATTDITLGPRGPLVTVGIWGSRSATFSFDALNRPATAMIGGNYMHMGRDGSLLTKGRPDDSYQAWNVLDLRKERTVPSPHERYAHDGLAFAGGRRALIRATVNGMNLFWVLDEGEPERRVQLPFHGAGPWTTSPEGELIALADPREIMVVSLSTGQLVAELPSIPHVVTLTASRHFVAAAGEDGDVVLSSTTGERVGRVSLAARCDHATALAISPDERTLAIGTGRGRVWVLRNGAVP